MPFCHSTSSATGSIPTSQLIEVADVANVAALSTLRQVEGSWGRPLTNKLNYYHNGVGFVVSSLMTTEPVSDLGDISEQVDNQKVLVIGDGWYRNDPVGGWTQIPTAGTVSLVTATEDGLKRRTGRLVVNSGTAIAVGVESIYELSGVTISSITGGTADMDGREIIVRVPSDSSFGQSSSIELDGSLGDVVTPTGITQLLMVYRHADTRWEELSRSKY